MTSLVDVAHELYALSPTEFTATRNERAAALNDPALAAAVTALRKPSASAWLANALVQHRPAELAQLLALGQELRKAQSDRDSTELTRLTGQRRVLIAGLAKTASALACDLGHPVRTPVTDDLAQTLQAATTDAAAAEALSTGRLLRALAVVGFDPVDLTDAVAVPEGRMATVTALPRRRPTDPAERRAFEAAEREEVAARAAVRDADSRVDSAERALDLVDQRIRAASRRREELELELVRAEARLRELRGDLAAADREARALDRDRDSAARAAESAGTAAELARERLT